MDTCKQAILLSGVLMHIVSDIGFRSLAVGPMLFLRQEWTCSQKVWLLVSMSDVLYLNPFNSRAFFRSCTARSTSQFSQVNC